MLQNMGRPDTGNMVPQLRRHMVGAYQLNLCVTDTDRPDEQQTDMWSIDEHTDTQHECNMLQPTAPEWSSDEDAPAQDSEVEVRPTMT